MITTSEILNKILPISKEDNNCGFKKAKKLRARAELVLLINEYRQGKQVDLPEQVLSLIESKGVMI